MVTPLFASMEVSSIVSVPDFGGQYTAVVSHVILQFLSVTFWLEFSPARQWPGQSFEA